MCIQFPANCPQLESGGPRLIPPSLCHTLMDSFSLMDQLRACLPCFHTSTRDDEERQSGAPELDGLLFNSEYDQTDTEADQMSLHSSVGVARLSRAKKPRRQKRSAMPKTIRLFGYDLFGRPRTSLLSPTHSEDDASTHEPHRRIRTISGSSLDPDATPVPDSTITNLSRGVNMWTPPLTDEQITREESEQREREERSARKAARRLRRQQRAEVVTEARAGLNVDPRVEETNFEGFPGGNATLARDSFHPSLQQSEPEAEFGPHIEGATRPLIEREESDEEVDIGGEYNRKSRSKKYGSGDGSSSRSMSYESSSITDGTLFVPPRSRRPTDLNLIQQRQAPHNVPLPPSSVDSSEGRRVKKTRSKSHNTRSQSSTSTSQPSSLASPVDPVAYNPHIRAEGTAQSLDVGGQGNGFPSAGFAISKTGRQGLQANQGVALAWNGDL